MPDASATEDLVLYETKDRIATITINRPDKLNALSNGVVAQLRDAMLRLQASDDMCAIVTAAGDRAFRSGPIYGTHRATRNSGNACREWALMSTSL